MNAILQAKCIICKTRHEVRRPARGDFELVRCCGKSSPVWMAQDGEVMFDGYIMPIEDKKAS